MLISSNLAIRSIWRTLALAALLLFGLGLHAPSAHAQALDPDDEVVDTPGDEASETDFDNYIDSYNRAGSTMVDATYWKAVKTQFLKGYRADGTWSGGRWKGNGMFDGGPTWGTAGYADLKVHYVRLSGSDSNSGTHKNQAWRTLQKALTSAPANSVIMVGAGVYQQNSCFTGTKTNAPGGMQIGCIIYGDKTGHYTGDAGNVVIRTPQGVNDWTLRFNEGSGYILSGLTFEEDPNAPTNNCRTSGLDWTQYINQGYRDMLGLLFDRSSQALVHNCTFTKFRHAAHLSWAVDVEFRNCTYTNTRYIHLYSYHSSQIRVFRCTFTDPDPNPMFNSMFQIHGYQSRIDLVRTTFNSDNQFKNQNDQTPSNERVYTYQVHAYANGYHGADTMQNLGMLRAWDCTFSNCNYIAYYGSWLRYFRSIRNTFTNVRYGSHGHAENSLTRDSTYTLPQDNPWRNQWSWACYQHSYTAAVRPQYTEEYAKYKKTPGISGRVYYSGLTFNNYYVNCYVGTAPTTFKDITVNGCNATDQNAPLWSYNNGVYYNSPGSGTFTINAASNLVLNNCWWGISAAYAPLVLDGVTISGQHHGVYMYDGDVTVRNSSIVDNKGHGFYAAWCPKVTLQNSTFNRNSRTYQWHWGAYAYGKKNPRAGVNTQAPGYDDWTERYLYGDYDGDLTVANCTFDENGSMGPNNDPSNGGLWGHGLGLHYFKTMNLSQNQANSNAYHGVYLGDAVYSLNGNNEFTATGNWMGICSSGYSSLGRVSPEFFTGRCDITGYNVSGNRYGVHLANTNSNVSNTTVTNNQYIGLYPYKTKGIFTDITATGNGTGVYVGDAQDSTFTRVRATGSTQGWGFSLHYYRQYYDEYVIRNIVIRDCDFSDNNYGGFAAGAYRHFKDENGNWKSDRATDAVIDVKNVTCHRNKHYGFHTYYCWVKEGPNLGISANDNGTPQVDADGNPVFISGTIRQKNWAVGIYPYQIGRTLNITSAQGITAQGNSYHGWLNYYDPIVIDSMTFAKNGTYGYNPNVGNGQFYGWGLSFYSAWNPSISITNTVCNGGGIQVNHFDSLSVNNITTNDCYMGLGVYWGYTDGNGKTWKPTTFELKNCTFNNGWYGYYQYGYDDNVVVPTTITNVTANNNKIYGFVNHRTPLTVRNLTATNNGYAGFHSWRCNVDMADSNISGNTTFTFENGSRWGYFGTLMYDWEQPRTYVVKNCTFNDNEGYGLYAGCDETGASISVEDCTLNNNRYHGYYGSVVSNTLTDLTANNSGRSDAGGYWGIVASPGSATLTNCTANNCNGGGIYVHGRYGSQTLTRPDGTTYTDYFALNDTATFTNCTANNNQHSGMYGVYATSSFANCQANGNRYYGIHAGHDNDAQTFSATIANSTVNDNGSIGIYGYDTRLTVSNTSVLRNGHGIYFPSPESEPDKGVFTNVNMSNGTGWGLLTYYQDTTVLNCQVNNNAGGGALLHYGKKDVVSDSTFNGNQNIGLYAYLSKDALFDRCTMKGNTSYGLYSWQTDKAFARNCVIASNTYGVLMDDNLHGSQMWNCTITGSTGYIGFRPYRGNVTLMNSIVANNTSYGIYNEGHGTFSHDNNLVYGHSAGTNYYRPGYTESQLVSTNEVRKPPRFVDSAAGDYRLAKGSPAINSGLNAPGTVDIDMLGNARPMYGRTEMGAYEYLDKSGSVRIVDWKEER